MKVLILSAEVWQDGTNGGNVLSNIFDGTGWDFAQIYCNPGAPRNSLCSHYYQMTDSMVVRGLLRYEPIGREFDLDDSSYGINFASAAEQPNKFVYSFFRSHPLQVFYFLKRFLWNRSNWKNDKLRRFVESFDPDIIFAPCYGDKFMLSLTRYVHEIAGVNVISYISDDHYTLRQVNFSPLFWANRLSVRKQLRRTFPLYSLVYTMTEEQREQCARDLGGNMKLLRKASSFSVPPNKVNFAKPVRFVYAGGIYLNRWKTLACVADAIREVNSCGAIVASLDIYTSTGISNAMKRSLDDGVSCRLHEPVSQEELAEIYRQSDVALHVESFDLRNRLRVRLSFSTKIVDCLSSGCAVMAVCDPEQGGFKYLLREDAAICVGSLSDVSTAVKKLVENRELVAEYAAKAAQCCVKNHGRADVLETITKDFNTFAR